MENLYESYAVLNSKIEELEAQKDALRPQIIQQMSEAHLDKVETGVGKFSITKLKKWAYPEAVLAINEEFKAAKAKAESTGEATYEETDSLRFTSVKL